MAKLSPGKQAAEKPSRMALIVHPDVGVISSLQAALAEKGYVVISARDLPMALLAITQHYFHVAIVASRLGEAGDGWPFAGVVHMVFPNALINVISPSEPDVLALQSAINYGVREIYRESIPAPEIVEAIVRELEGAPSDRKRSRIQ